MPPRFFAATLTGNNFCEHRLFSFHFSPEKSATGQFMTESLMANPRLITGRQHHHSTGIPKILLCAARSPKSFIRTPQRYTNPLLKIILTLLWF
jgi:hypothetical protein